MIAPSDSKLIVISSIRFFTYEYLKLGIGVRVVAVATCALCAWLLYRKRDLSLRQIRAVEESLGDGVKRVFEREIPVMNKLRRVP